MASALTKARGQDWELGLGRTCWTGRRRYARHNVEQVCGCEHNEREG
jgi:hypothetical protein